MLRCGGSVSFLSRYPVRSRLGMVSVPGRGEGRDLPWLKVCCGGGGLSYGRLSVGGRPPPPPEGGWREGGWPDMGGVRDSGGVRDMGGVRLSLPALLNVRCTGPPLGMVSGGGPPWRSGSWTPIMSAMSSSACVLVISPVLTISCRSGDNSMDPEDRAGGVSRMEACMALCISMSSSPAAMSVPEGVRIIRGGSANEGPPPVPSSAANS
mmetsp:Transcript_148682/g.477442  ORF Transcript_148682/g.477442 Transcript_148682/m.477442 type:complete len:209 (-) Transcript_148682:174-800(-)